MSITTQDSAVVFKVIRRLSQTASALEDGKSGEAREAFFLALSFKALRFALADKHNEETARDLIGVLVDDAPELDLELVDNIPESFFVEPTALGWAYQIWNGHLRDASSWGVSKKEDERNEFVDLAPVTQLFTDRYIADFLAARSIDLWRASKDRGTDCPTICDPALGTGHILIAAIDALISRGVGANSIPLRLFGYDIDPLCVRIARVALFCHLVRVGYSGDLVDLSGLLAKSLVNVEAPYGSLNRNDPVWSDIANFDCIVTNPPYLGRRKLPTIFREFLDREYPATAIDLCAAFMQRCIELLSPSGTVGMVASDKWIRLRQYGSVREGDGSFRGLFGELTIDGIYDLGARAFAPIAEMHDGMRAAILIGRKAAPDRSHRLTYASLGAFTDYSEKQSALKSCLNEGVYSQHLKSVRQSELAKGGLALLQISDLPSRYALLPRRVGDYADIVVGVQTSNDARFVRYVWQAPEDRVGWRVHCKGGGYGRWGGRAHWIIDWQAGRGGFLGSQRAEAQAEKWMAKDAWIYSWLANGQLGLRRKHGGWSFGRAAAGGVFPSDRRLVAFLNSRIASIAVQTIGGKIQLPEGTVKSVPAASSLESINESFIDSAVELRERIVSTELNEALFRAGEIPKLEALLMSEALILVLEAALEQQVEQGLELSLPERKDLSRSFGGLVGWFRPSVPLVEHSVFRDIPAAYRGVIERCAGIELGVVLSSKSEFSLDDIGDIETASKLDLLIDSKWLLPSSGVVESVSRALKIHPFDALLVLKSILNRPSAFACDLYTSHLAKCVLDDVLRKLGHRWWIQPKGETASFYQTLCSSDLVSLAEGVLSSHGVPEALGLSADKLVQVLFLTWQDRYFFRESPLLVSKSNGRLRDVSLRLTRESDSVAI
jgi:hypothetical protein